MEVEDMEEGDMVGEDMGEAMAEVVDMAAVVILQFMVGQAAWVVGMEGVAEDMEDMEAMVVVMVALAVMEAMVVAMVGVMEAVEVVVMVEEAMEVATLAAAVAAMEEAMAEQAMAGEAVEADHLVDTILKEQTAHITHTKIKLHKNRVFLQHYYPVLKTTPQFTHHISRQYNSIIQ